MIKKLQSMYTADYLIYLLEEELILSDYNIYDHKRTRKILRDILSKYIDDYTFSVRDDGYGNKELNVTIYDRFYLEDPEDVSITVTVLAY